jgi:putative transposase
MMNSRKREDQAIERFQVLAPLLAEGHDPAKIRQIKQQICKETGLSERTVRRYMAKYRLHGLEGLKPKTRGRSVEIVIPEDVLKEAILLRREVPGRSVRQIIQILEWEEKIPKGSLKRSTLQEHLQRQGYSARHLRMYASKGTAARRFQKRHRNELWQSDLKFGPYIVDAHGNKRQAYLVLIVDDATRLVIHGQWYDNQEQTIVQDALRQAFLKRGLPSAVYFDNGKQYRNKWMIRACAKLGIKLIFTKPYSPESKGKCERINRTVDHFLDELKLEKSTSLDELNTWFQAWLEECYQNKPHSALEQQMSPEVAYRSDPHVLRFAAPDQLADAFLHAEERKVDKVGCISFQGKKYEVGLAFIGYTVGVVYDPADTKEITIEYEGYTPWKAKELVIGSRAGKRPALPESMQTRASDSSRLLHGAKQKHDERRANQKPAVSYRHMSTEGTHHV